MFLLDEVNAIESLGLEGDIHAVKESSRQVLLIEKETLDALKLKPAMLRENVTTEGIPLMSLQRKQRLQVGKAVFEITNECEPCERMEELRAGLQDELTGRRGMLAKVVRGGPIRVGDPVTILS
jgi:MOSC domain-containing protein YiiM